MKAKLLMLLLLWGGLQYSGMAQNHINMWTRATLSYPVTKKIRTDAELQHRRQNGFEDHTMYRAPLMLSCRTWVHYQPARGLRLSLSPFAWFSNYRIIQLLSDEHQQPLAELRFTAAAEQQLNITTALTGFGRAGAEYRVWQSSQTNVTRARARIGLRYEVNKRLSVMASDELLVNVAGVKDAHSYDHNRIAAGGQYQLLPSLRAEAGYIYIDRLPLSGSNHLFENNIYLNLTADLGKILPRQGKNE